ncbi:MAG: PEP-CTERM sorting domain-containing protein [Planctomycetes bacterium]|nr:PEP-CTERM sorting domain-containing protein [Planctomycetota bacterium]
MKPALPALLLLLFLSCPAPLPAQGSARPLPLGSDEHPRGGTPAPAVLLLLGGAAGGYWLFRRRGGPRR